MAWKTQNYEHLISPTLMYINNAFPILEFLFLLIEKLILKWKWKNYKNSQDSLENEHDRMTFYTG